MPPPTTKNPAILIVSGVWHGSSCFYPLHQQLVNAAYSLYAIQLPSVGAENPSSDLAADVSAVRSSVLYNDLDANLAARCIEALQHQKPWSNAVKASLCSCEAHAIDICTLRAGPVQSTGSSRAHVLSATGAVG